MIKFFISVTSHALDPPVTNCHTLSDPLECDVLYGRPLSIMAELMISVISIVYVFGAEQIALNINGCSFTAIIQVRLEV